MRVTCPQCGKTSEGPVDALGRIVRCPSCQATFTLPPAAPEKPPIAEVTKDETSAPTKASSLKLASDYRADVESATSEFFSGLLSVVGFLIVMGSIVVGVSQGNSAHFLFGRFQDDNAVGAAANSLEQIQYWWPVWRWLAFGISILCYAQLREIARLLRRRGE